MKNRTKPKKLTVTLICVAILLGMSCSLFGSPQTPTPRSSGNSIWIKADQGGTLDLSNGASLEIAPKSLPADGEISLEQVSETAQAAEYFAPAGSLYEVSLGAPVLDPPATITLPYDPALLPPDVAPETLFLAYYDEATGKWVYAGGDVDINRQVVSVQTSHASRWSVFHWNWDAWIALLSKTLEGNVVGWIEAIDLLTNDCPQAGASVRVSNVNMQNVIQGCVENDDFLHPRLRVVNPKSFYYEIRSISTEQDVSISQLLAPGESVEFTVDLRRPSPLIVAAEITGDAGYRLVIHLVLSMLPGFNAIESQPHLLACVTERVKDVSYFASATESLLDGNGAAASEQLIKFYRDEDAMRRFLTATDDCGSGLDKSWDLKKVSLIASLSNVIISSVDYIANTLAMTFRGETQAQVAFEWNMVISEAPIVTPIPLQGGLPPLNRSDPQSVLDWVQYGMKSGDLAIFNQLVPPEGVFYAYYLEGGQNVSPQNFINDLNERIPSHPTCWGVYLDEYYLQIWYSKWVPAWKMTEMCYGECNPIDPPWLSETAAFFFFQLEGEYQLKSMHLNLPYDYYYFSEHLPLIACSQGVQNFATATPAPSCPGAPMQRLQMGESGKVCTQKDSVILRVQPDRGSTSITKLPPGTTFSVVGGPECGGNNWSWWQVLTDDGQSGWIAEGGDEIDPYFLCPLP